MLQGPLAVFTAFRRFYGRPGLSVVLNGLTFLLSLPLVLVATTVGLLTGRFVLIPFLLTLFLGVLPNPAAAGLQYFARLIADDDPADFSDFRKGLRLYWRPATVLFVTSVVSLFVILVNVVFYAAQPGSIFRVLELIWLSLLLSWLMAHVYLYPMVFAVEERKITLVYRNSLVLAFRRPFSTVFVLGFWLVWLLFSSFIGLVLIAGLILAAVIQNSLLLRVLPSVAGSRAGASHTAVPSPKLPDSSESKPLPKKGKSRTQP